MNTTKGKWDVLSIEHPASPRPRYMVGPSGVDTFKFGERTIDVTPEVCTLYDCPEAEANAELIALAGNLNQKYDLSKIGRLVEEARTLLGWIDSDNKNNRDIAIRAFIIALNAFTR